jgi:hypothetical protein
VVSILHGARHGVCLNERSDDDYDVLADGVVVGRIMKAAEHLAPHHG